nr:class I SAM-dependent methyltransferase [uncultured Sulfurimonas sp.]
MLDQRTLCPVCDSKESHLLRKFKYEKLYDFFAIYDGFNKNDFDSIKGKYYTLLQCKDCRHIYQVMVPNENFSYTLYEKWINSDTSYKYQKSKYNSRFFNILQYEINILFHHFGRDPSTIKILDFGAGWGDFAILAKAHGFDVYAAELSDARLKNLQKNNIKVISLQECDIEFDYIRSDQVFEHLGNPKVVLQQLKDLLHTDGILRITVPNSDGFETLLSKTDENEKLDFQGKFNAIFPLEHLNCFNPKNLELMANKVNLKKYKFPLKTEYASSTNWAIKNILSNLYKPIINRYLKDKNNMCFKK